MRNSVTMCSKDETFGHHSVQEKEPEVEDTESKTTDSKAKIKDKRPPTM